MNKTIKIDNYINTTRRKDDYISRKNDINYILKHCGDEITAEDLMELPDYIIKDMAYDIREFME